MVKIDSFQAQHIFQPKTVGIYAKFQDSTFNNRWAGLAIN